MGNTNVKTSINFEEELQNCKTLEDVTEKDGIIQKMIKVAMNLLLFRKYNT